MLRRTVALIGGMVLCGAAAVRAADATPPGKTTTPAANAVVTPAPVDTAALEKAVVGKWKSVDDGEVIEFAAGGGVHIIQPGMGFGGTYKFDDAGNLIFDIAAFKKFGLVTYKFEMQDTTIILTTPASGPRKYKRVP